MFHQKRAVFNKMMQLFCANSIGHRLQIVVIFEEPRHFWASVLGQECCMEWSITHFVENVRRSRERQTPDTAHQIDVFW